MRALRLLQPVQALRGVKVIRIDNVNRVARVEVVVNIYVHRLKVKRVYVCNRVEKGRRSKKALPSDVLMVGG